MAIIGQRRSRSDDGRAGQRIQHPHLHLHAPQCPNSNACPVYTWVRIVECLCSRGAIIESTPYFRMAPNHLLGFSRNIHGTRCSCFYSSPYSMYVERYILLLLYTVLVVCASIVRNPENTKMDEEVISIPCLQIIVCLVRQRN